MDIIKGMKTCNNLYDVPAKLLKLIPHKIVDIIVNLCNQCLMDGCFPKVFKIAKVIPLFKKGDREKIDNYRPISILPTLSKILEKIIFNRFYSFLNTKGFISKNQFGFRPNKDTKQAMLKLS